MSATPAAGAWRDLLGGSRRRLSIGLCVVELAAGAQALITTAIMPSILGDLGGVEFYGWVFSGYSLAALVSIPLAGRAVDREGPARPFARMFAVFVAGTVLAGAAPTMPLLAAARLVQGYGAAAQYTIAYGAVAKVYPAAGRARMLALLSGVWIVSGLAGPSFGVAVAQTLGWRWAFLAVVPVAAVAAWLVLPGLRGVPAAVQPGARLPVGWPLLLAAGASVCLGGLGAGSLVLAAPLTFGGAALVAVALRRILPAGTLRVRRGLPATMVVSFLLNVAFFGADAFVPLLVTGVRGRSVTESGIVVTAVTLSWTLGNTWQARAVGRLPPVLLTAGGAVAMAAGLAGIGLACAGLPLSLCYAAWVVAGAGMGVAYPTVMMASMGHAAAGTEGEVIAGRFVAGRLGIALGTGLGGASVALAAARGTSLRVGVGGVFGLCTAAALLAALVAGRATPRPAAAPGAWPATG